MKRRIYGTPAEIIRRAVDELGGLEEAGLVLGLGHSRVAVFTDPNADGDGIPYARVRQLVRAGAKAPVEDLCALAGGSFQPGGAGSACPKAAAARSAKEYGEWLAAMFSGAPTPDQLRELDDVIRALTETRVALMAAGKDGAA